MEKINSNQIKGIILGATGAIGKDLVKELIASPKWVEIVVIVRKALDEWKTFDNQKLKIIEVSSLDLLENTENWKKFENYNTVFSCLGSRSKLGKEAFYKVDYTYVHYGAKIAKINNIPNFSLLSGVGADKKSMFLYCKTKGEIEETLKKMEFENLSIFHPGLLLNRDNDQRLGEKILKYFPIPKIEAKDMAKAMRIETELLIEKKNSEIKNQIFIYNNDQIKNIAKSKL